MASPNTRRNNNADSRDLYITPQKALKEMTYFLKPGDVLFDPCAGLNDMADYFKKEGFKCYTNELYDYGYPYDFKNNYLEMAVLPPDVNVIVMNPPFTLTKEFIDASLSHVDNIIMFNRLTVLESYGRSIKFASKEWPLKECRVFGRRVTCTKGTDRKSTANSTPYAIYHFDRNHSGNPKLSWITD